MRSTRSRLFLLLQYLLPKHLLTALISHVSQIRVVAIKNRLIGAFVRAYDVDTEEANADVPQDYADFNAFFTRELKPGARPIDASGDSVVSPVDGAVSAIGIIDEQQLMQAKGLSYDLAELLATDLNDAKTYANGNFATIYLAPHNYHRVHSPLDAKLVAARYVPGDLFSVNAATVSLLPRLFARNERLILHFATAGGPMMLVLVGALNVGSISTSWTGRIRPRKRGVVQEIALNRDQSELQVGKGDLLGWFNMGSTVIMLQPPGCCRWQDGIESGKVLRMGERIGTTGSGE